MPIPELVYKARVSDKSLHFLAYLVLVFLLWFAVCPDRTVNWRKAGVWWILFVVVWYGVIDELLQGYVGRTCDVVDFLVDLAGTVAALILLTFVTFWPACLVVTSIVIFLLTNLARANLADLLPVTSAIFYLLAYGLLTAVWIQCMHLFLSLKVRQPKWLIGALGPPTAFLFTVKFFSAILERNFTLRSVILSAVGIAAVIAAAFLAVLLRPGSAQELSPGDSERPV
jgi:hypothetical protein